MKTKVLIVDDSVFFCEITKKAVNAVGGFSVCATAKDVGEAVTKIEKLRPELIFLDIEMPGIDGLKFLKSLLPQYPVPVIVCSARADKAAQALGLGAADFIVKPTGADFGSFFENVRAAMLNAVNLREVRSGDTVFKLRRSAEVQTDTGLILIGGSAGSVDALPVILGEFDESCPPVAITVHLPEGYAKMFAENLDSRVKIKVTQAHDGMKLRRGTAVIAQGNRHLKLIFDGCYKTVCETGQKVSGHIPSVDVMFRSAAKLDAKKIIAAILTGMGSDGADGLLALKNSGAFTIGQDEKTSLVYGMPKAAAELGAVCVQSPLSKIGELIKQKYKSMG